MGKRFALSLLVAGLCASVALMAVYIAASLGSDSENAEMAPTVINVIFAVAALDCLAGLLLIYAGKATIAFVLLAVTVITIFPTVILLFA